MPKYCYQHRINTLTQTNLVLFMSFDQRILIPFVIQNINYFSIEEYMYSHLLISQQQFHILRLNTFISFQAVVDSYVIDQSLESIHLKNRDIHQGQILKRHGSSIVNQIVIDFGLVLKRIIQRQLEYMVDKFEGLDEIVEE